jgi:hypothetical protein
MPLLADSLEERVAEHTIRLSRSVEILDTSIEAPRLDETRRNRGIANTFDHRSEGLPRKSIDQVRSARIDVYHSRGNTDLVETRVDHQRVKLSAD